VFPHREYARERIAQTAARLAVYDRPAPLSLELSGPVGRGSGPGEYRPVELGERLGPLFATYWLRATGSAAGAKARSARTSRATGS
jgi:alpha-mannosidase